MVMQESTKRGPSAIFTVNGLQIHRDKHLAIVTLDGQLKPVGTPEYSHAQD